MTLLDLLRESGIPYKLHGEHHHVSKKWLGVDCPWCSPKSGHYRLGLPPSGRGCHCWSCGNKSTTEALVLLTGLPRPEVHHLLELLGRNTKEAQPPRTNKLVLPPGLGPLLPLQREYLRGRGFDPDELAEDWGLRGIGLAPRLAWKIWIPIHDNSGQLISWTTRAPSDEAKPKYVTAEVEESLRSPKETLYGLHRVPGHAVVVVEGPTGSWRLGRGVVATLGVAYSRAQTLLLSKFPVRVVVFDSEPEAQERARSLCDELHCFPGDTWRVELDAADPGEAGPHEVRRLRRLFLER